MNTLHLNTFPTQQIPQEQKNPAIHIPQKDVEAILPELPEDIHAILLTYLRPADLAKTHTVSKKWEILSDKALINWINENSEKQIPKCRLINTEIDFIKKHGKNLKSLNLNGRRVDNNQIKELTSYCKNLNRLFICNINVPFLL